MNIPAIVFPVITPAALSAVTGVNAISLLTTSLTDISGVDSASIVDLSKFGQLLSAMTNLKAVSAQAATPSTAIGQNTDFGTFVAATQLFINAFNSFQNDYVDTTQNSLGTSPNIALESMLNTQSVSGSGKTLLADLAQIGITYQAATLLSTSAGQFNLDLTTLQSAYNSNPTGTVSLLNQALTAIGQVAAQLVVQTASLFTTGSNTALTGNVPASQFDINALTGPIATLSPENAAIVNAALQHLLNQQALAQAVVENQAAAPTALTANTEAAAPAANVQAATTLVSQTAATAALTSATPVENAAAPIQPGLLNSVGTTTVPQAPAQVGAAQAEVNPVPPRANEAVLQQPSAPPPAESAAATAPALPENGSANVPGANAPNGQPTNFTLSITVAEATNATVAQGAAVANTGTTSAQTTTTTAPATQQGNNAVIIATAATNPAPAAINATAGTVFATANNIAPNQLAAPISITPPVAAPQAAAEVAVAAAAAVPTAPPSPPLSDPSYAAAVAAYHVNDAMLGTQNNIEAKPLPEPISDVVEVTRVRPTTLNLHEGGSYGGRRTGTHQAGNVAPASESAAPSQHSVDIAI